jgi:hypothetical protein
MKKEKFSFFLYSFSVIGKEADFDTLFAEKTGKMKR